MALTQNTNSLSSNNPDQKRNIIILIGAVSLMIGLIITMVILQKNQETKAKAMVEKVGKVAETAKHGDTTAWLLELPQGGTAVVYTTGDNKVLLRGTAYNFETGDPIFTSLVEKATVQDDMGASSNPKEAEATPAPATAAATATGSASSVSPELSQLGVNDLTAGQAIGKWEGKVPAVIEILDKLGGYKEDPSISADNTVYVMYDPRCPYCHKLFEVTRNLDQKGKNVTIKWLPTVALGGGEATSNEMKRAAMALHVKTPEEFASTLTKDSQGMANVSQQDMQKVNENLSLLYEAASQVFGSDAKVAVPAAFYIDKRTGSPRLVYAAQEPDVYKTIFGN